MVDTVAPLLTGIVLASVAGLRAFLPLAALGWAAHLNLLQLNGAFSWLAMPPVMAALTVAVVLEAVGDKVPVVDHALDVLGTLARPLAGVIAVAAPAVELSPPWALLAGVVAGAPLAGGVHVLKAKGRLLANVATAGLAAPVLSVIEDVAGIVLVVCGLAIPVLALALAALTAWALLRLRAGRVASVAGERPPH